LNGIADAAKPRNKPHWRIYYDNAEISETIGIGRTEEAAWKDAANRLQIQATAIN
jgi:cell division protein FtsN